jgi:hypothetical protein
LIPFAILIVGYTNRCSTSYGIAWSGVPEHPPKGLHPKKFIKFQVYKKYKTSKRAISAVDMKLLESYEADYTSRVYRNQQIFLFSYYCRGTNYNDIVKLKEKNSMATS